MIQNTELVQYEVQVLSSFSSLDVHPGPFEQASETWYSPKTLCCLLSQKEMLGGPIT